MSNVVAMRQHDQAAEQLPFNMGLERGFLGALFMRNAVYQRVGSALKPEHFMEPVHQWIYEVAGEIIAAGGVANPVTLPTYLGNADLGGETVSEYLARCVREACEPVNAIAYARDIAVLAARRTMIQATEEIRAMAMDAPVGMTPAELLARFEGKMEAIRPMMGGRSKGFEPFGVVATRAIDKIADDWRNSGVKRGLSTGYERIDEFLGGLEPPNLIVLGGRPGMAKSGLAMNISVHVAKQILALRAEGHKTGVVGIFSLEMSGEQLVERVLSEQSKLAAFRVKRRSSLTKNELEKLVGTAHDLRDIPIEIDQTPEMPIAQLLSRARDLYKRKGIALVVIDYLQLIQGFDTRSKDPNRAQDLSRITSALKGLAKELNIPILLLAQVSRDIDKRDDKRPLKSDLRESGATEQDADQILFIYREEYYLAGEKPHERKGPEALAKWERDMRACEGVAEIIIAKQRHGPTGTAVLGYDSKRILFLNEPTEREIEPAEVRKRAAKKPTFTAEGTILYGLIKSLTVTRSELATQEQRGSDRKLCKGARLVPLEEARQAFADNVMPGESEQAVKTRFRAAFVSLQKAEIAFYHGVVETGFWVWLPELAADLS